MIKNPRLLQRFEENELRKERIDYASALKLFEGMWREGMELGVLPLEEALEGIEVDIQIARILNRVRSAH
ncbi:MAG: hypothetical protein KKE57_00375 [Proteobacteria bacterium]|nr:hypothetical protein [Pseudomonadota bacterium]